MNRRMSSLSLGESDSEHESSMSHAEHPTHAGLGYRADAPVYVQSPRKSKAKKVPNRSSKTAANHTGAFVRTPLDNRTNTSDNTTNQEFTQDALAYNSSSSGDDSDDTFAGLGFGTNAKKALYDDDGFDPYMDSQISDTAFDLYSMKPKKGPPLTRSEKKAKRTAERLAMRENGEVKRSMKQHTPIPDSNMGSKMLRSMGWSAGTGLGKHRDGRTVPVLATRNNGRKGLGTS